jgi:membrane-bound lytic murein transglycosylase D
VSDNNIKNSNRIYSGQKLKIPKTTDKHEKGELENLENMSINKIELAELESKTIDYDRKASSSYLLPVSLKKDPNGKYLVGFIFAETDETIGHYAEWSKVSTRIIRKINGFRYGQYIHLKQKIKIPFLTVTPDVFFQKRSEYHKSIQEDFFDNYKVEKIIKYPVKTGLTVWKLCNEIYDIPLWLLKRYNPNADIEHLRKGEEIYIPITSEILS